MKLNEAEAHKLVACLTELGIPAKVNGAGVNWKVDIAPKGGRSMSVTCFWYEPHIGTIILGMNPGNARSSLKQERKPHEGPEFCVTLISDGNHIADGRTGSQKEVLTCAISWLSGATIDMLVQEVPFIDEKRRAMKAVSVQLDPRLTWEIKGGPFFDLWVYGIPRSCRVRDDSCAFFIGQAQVAFLQHTKDAPGDVAVWLLKNVPLSSLLTRGAKLERHAKVIESDPARWHWLHVRDRIADPNDVLFPLAPLISTLADSPIASRYFTFSSLDRLCFSASSHYPWVGEFPSVTFIGEQEYTVGDVRCNLADAVARIESALAKSSVKPFFGSKTDLDIHILERIFAQQGSLLRPQLVRSGQWADIMVVRGTRKCRLSLNYITCIEGKIKFSAACSAPDDVVRIAIRYLLNQATFDELKTDPGIKSYG